MTVEGAVLDANQFERDKACYEQNCEQLRSLNQIMWQVPIIAMTLTGGLWYAVGTVTDMHDNARCILLVYSGIANIGLILMISRVRDVIEHYLGKIKAFNASAFVEANLSQGQWALKGNRSVCRTFSVLMGIAAAISLVAACMVVSGGWAPMKAAIATCVN